MKLLKNHHTRTTVILLFVLVTGAQFSSYADRDEAANRTLLETGSAAKVNTAPPSPSSIKIISYNIRWRGGEDLRRLIELFKTDAEVGHASIIGLQEVDRNKKRTANTNTARMMAEELGMHYAWAAPPSPQKKEKETQEEETGVAILSVYPLSDVTRIVLPNDGPGGRRRAAIGATVQIGKTKVRCYSIHAELRMSNERRLQQFQAVLDDLNAHHAKIERVVVVGDFNTLTGKDVDATTELFTKAKFFTPFDNTSTWKTLMIELKLDWVWLRGFEVVNHGIDKKIGLSDHWPLWVNLTMNDTEHEQGVKRKE